MPTRQATPPREPNPERAALWPLLLTAAAAVLAFLPALDNGFVNWDDHKNLVENPHYRGLGLEQLKWMLTSFHMGHYIPLTWLSFALDYLTWGMDPKGYHLTNVILHAASACAFHLLSLRVLSLRAAHSADRGALRWAALASGLLFAVHPLRAESVAWVTERRDLLSGGLYWTTLLLYLRSRGSWPVATFALALLAKSSVMTLPGALVLLDVFVLGRLPRSPARWGTPELRGVWREKLPYLVLAAAAAVVAFLAQVPLQAAADLRAYGPVERGVTALYGLAFYLWKTVLPLGLSPLYQRPPRFDPWEARFLAGALAVAAVSAAAWALRRRNPALLGVWLHYALTLAPMLGLIRSGPQLVADRYSYLACGGWALLAGGSVLWAWPRRRSIAGGSALAALVLALAVLGGLSRRQARVWKDSETLWRHALRQRPDTVFAHNNLGLALQEQGRHEEAIAHFREAARLYPYARPYNNWASSLRALGREEEAAGRYERALKLEPGNAQANLHLAIHHAKAGRWARAAPHYEKGLDAGPDPAGVRADLCLALNHLGRAEEAARRCREALALDPSHLAARYNLALATLLAGDREGGEALLREVLRRSPGHTGARANLKALAASGI